MRSLPLITLLALAGCVAEREIPNGAKAFATDCAGCHGSAGQGNGPLAQQAGFTAPDLTKLAAKNGGIFPREAVMATIDGLNRPPHFSAAMPEFGAGDLGEVVIVATPDGLGTPTPVRLIALADYLARIQAR